MIELIFSLLLVPILPELADPVESHSMALRELDRRLSRGGPNSIGVAENAAAGPSANVLVSDSPSLPVITGWLFEWSNINSIVSLGEVAVSGLSAVSLRLTGLIEISGQRVAILNDGEKDHVVGIGSYVLNTHRVETLGRRHVVLMPLNVEAGGARLELNLMPGDLPRGLE